MKRRTKSRICSFAMAACFGVCMVKETLAYDWDQTIDTTNEFQPGIYTTVLEEDFTAPTDWMPGIETNKDVWVSNEGTVPVFAKIELSQSWIRTENIYDLDGNVIAPEEGEALSLTFQGEDDLEYAALITWGEDVVMLSDSLSEDVTASVLSWGVQTVDTLEEAAGKWLLVEDADDGNLVFYYMGVIEAGTSSPWLIDSVEMNPSIEASITEVHTVWEKTDGTWGTVTTFVENYESYENAEYTLTVTMTTVQATAEAVEECFGSSVLSEQSIIAYLQTLAHGASYSRDDSVTEKKLYISQSGGVLTFVPDAPEENWFLSYLNMMPGETYTDTLLIENLNSSTYSLYMQAILKDTQSQLAEELLEYITITVTYNGDVIYQGSADGVDVDDTLFEVIPLGDYSSGETNQIDVSITLSKDLPIEYAGILATTDWQFMVIHKSSGGGSDPDPDPTTDPDDPTTDPDDPLTDIPDGDVPQGDFPDFDFPDLEIPELDIPLINMPQTGDIGNFLEYLAVMAAAGFGFVYCLVKLKRSYREEDE
ncbi:BsaA family SipW-dependent biofilm matrix protein [Bengtsoniella intestinalis]|uniref:BsaA family SipW-dependent biofilm matrix protein n=1 Tax=Bengtsoniella intestinalis TaxID=3073143 RepID=UPI00391F7C5E